MSSKHSTCVYIGQQIADYHFGSSHPFGPARHDKFVAEFQSQQLNEQVDVLSPVQATQQDLLRFHTQYYVDRVKGLSETGSGYLDGGDTPVMPGIYDIARYVVGSTIDGVRNIMSGQYSRGFSPIAGLHHARRDAAAGFCVFNDCGVAIEILKSEFGLKRIAYVDIDAHHGDGVFYGFEDDASVVFVDLHEDGRFLYPGSGAVTETGRGAAQGMKLNIPLPPDSSDDEFFKVWESVETFLEKNKPEFILLQCGADSIAGDPITHMKYSFRPHAHAAQRLCVLAEQLCDGRVFAMGGGGYNLENLAKGWCGVVKAFSEFETIQHNSYSG